MRCTGIKLSFALLSLAFLLSPGASALGVAPANDNCGNATVLAGNDFATVVDLSQATIQTCEATAPCESNSQRSVWYRFTPAQDGLLSVSASFIVNGEMPVVAVFDGCAVSVFGDCVQPDTLACKVGQTFVGLTYASIYDLPVSAGQPLLIKVAMDVGSGSAVDLEIEYHPSLPNDLCSNATIFSISPYQSSGDLEGVPVVQSNCDGSQSACPDSNAYRTIWYEFNAPADGTLELNTSANTFDTMLTVYDGCPIPILGKCASNELACDADPINASLQLPVDSGATYLIRLAETGSYEDQLYFQFNAAFIPSNDHCGSATVIPTNSFHPPPLPIGSADSTQQEPQESCETSVFGVQQSVFYRFTAPEDGVANIDTIGSTFDTVLSVFDGCGTIALPDNWIQPTQLACSNDIGGLLGEVSSISDLAMQAGHTYTIKVASTDEASPQSLLDFNFTFTSTTCPGDIVPAGGNDVVNVDDLLAVINAWGPCSDPYICPGDIAPAGGDGAVNVDDLLAVINAWGACP